MCSEKTTDADPYSDGPAEEADLPDQVTASQGQYRLLFDMAVDGMYVVSHDGIIIEANRRASEQTGYSHEELLGMPVAQLDALESQNDVAARLDGVLSREGGVFESEHRRKDGTTFPVEASARPIDYEGQRAVLSVARDIASRKTAERERERLLDVLDRSLNEIYMFDPETLVFEYVNHGALSNLGYTLEQMRTMTPVDIKPLYTRERFRELVAPLVESGEGKIVFETVHGRKNGDEYPVEVHLQFVDNSGHPVFLAVINDITQRKAIDDRIKGLNESLERRVDKRTAELRDTNARLREAQLVKDEFMANMSHELRTPLNSVIGFSGVLLSGTPGPLNDEQRTQLGMISASGKHLLALISDILDLSAIETGHMSFEFGPVDVGRLVDRVCSSAVPLAQAKGIDLVWDESGAGIIIHSELTRAGQILTNLIGNAVKFTQPPGGVRVRVGRAGTQVSFEIEDDGPGIAAEDLDAIFDRFYQVHDPWPGKPAGTGLGLHISRRLAHDLGGEIQVRSELGTGSTFTLYLPCGASELG